jgi:hypothetical protein
MPAESRSKGFFDLSGAAIDAGFQRLPDGRSVYHPWGIFSRSGYALTDDQRAPVEAHIRRGYRWSTLFAVLGWLVIGNLLTLFMPTLLAFCFLGAAGASPIVWYEIELRRLLASAERCNIPSPQRQSALRFVAALTRRDTALLGAMVMIPALLLLAQLLFSAGPWFVVAGGLVSLGLVAGVLLIYFRH